jgi:hypothetical protein
MSSLSIATAVWARAAVGAHASAASANAAAVLSKYRRVVVMCAPPEFEPPTGPLIRTSVLLPTA